MDGGVCGCVVEIDYLHTEIMVYYADDEVIHNLKIVEYKYRSTKEESR